ncbi:glycosyltransferase family 2 protein [Sphingomonas sp. 3-13AW]|uniref:glycosyltransferase family 2 protein n=1 Tax=Sphingomonas sp. 3-13AW TaxID=3050450 RepID=UPI003BB4C6BB
MTDQSLNLTICVVLYRSAEISRRFAGEISASLQGYSDWEIIFYDNSPTDELADLATFGTYRHDPRNLGFSFANNQAILSARYTNIALINPDVFGFSADFWDRLARQALGRSDVRFVKLLNEDGSHQDCVGEVSSLSRAWRSPVDYASLTTEQPIGMGIMAFMLTTREIFARVGLLDCDYPLYAEDMDWCFRANRSGIAVLYDPTFVLTHLGGASANDRWATYQSLRRKYAAEQVFIDKHYRGLEWLGMRALNKIKPAIRAPRT